MKIINKGFRVLILTLILILPSSSIKAFNHENIDVKLIGHRGASAYEPENTGQRRNPYDGICQKNGTEDYVRDAVFYSFVCASYEPGIFSGSV